MPEQVKMSVISKLSSMVTFSGGQLTIRAGGPRHPSGLPDGSKLILYTYSVGWALMIQTPEGATPIPLGVCHDSVRRGTAVLYSRCMYTHPLFGDSQIFVKIFDLGKGTNSGSSEIRNLRKLTQQFPEMAGVRFPMYLTSYSDAKNGVGILFSLNRGPEKHTIDSKVALNWMREKPKSLSFWEITESVFETLVIIRRKSGKGYEPFNKGTAHLDVKPANIAIPYDMDGGVLLLDWESKGNETDWSGVKRSMTTSYRTPEGGDVGSMGLSILHICMFILGETGYHSMTFQQKEDYLDNLLKESELRTNPKLLNIGVTQRLLFLMKGWISEFVRPEVALEQMRCPVHITVDSYWVKFFDSRRKISEQQRTEPSPLPVESGDSSDEGVESD